MLKKVGFSLLLISISLLSLIWTLNAGYASEPTITLPLFIENQYAFDVFVVIDPHEQLQKIEGTGLLLALKDWLEPNVLSTLESKMTGDEGAHQWLLVSSVTDTGMNLNYSPQTLELKINIPFLIRKPRITSISNNRREELKRSNEQSPLSSFLNFQAAQDFQNGRRPLRADVDGAVQFHQWVLEGRGRVNEEPPHRWVRDDFRLVKDDLPHCVRYSAGDLGFTTTGFQRFIPMGGISASSNFGLQPFRTVTPSGNHEIVLKSPSVIKIWLNGRLLQSISLGPGRHDLRDFPFGTGLNDVIFEIQDDVGQIETIKYTDAHSDNLLAQGVHDLQYALGAPSTQTGVNRKYQLEKTIVSLAHRYGINDHFTSGAFIQANTDQATYGVSSYFSTRLGNLGADIAGSKIFARNVDGAALRLSYLLSDFSAYHSSQRTFNLGYEYRTSYFSGLGETGSRQPLAADLISSVSQGIGHVLTLTLSARKGFNYPDANKIEPRSFSLGLSRNWGNGVDSLLTITHNRDLVTLTPVETIGTLFIIIALGDKNQYLNTRASTADRAIGVEYGNNSSKVVGGTSYSLGAEKSDTSQKADARVDYISNRATLRLTHEIYKSTNSSYADATHTTGIRIGSSIAYAGGSFALSRPIRESFVLYRPVQNLSDYEVHLNSNSEGQYESSSGPLGAAILPEVPAYRSYPLSVEAPGLPLGVTLPLENYVIKNTYKAGTEITALNESTVFASGILVLDDKPISLASGELRLISDSAKDPIVFFTNRDGKFSLSSVKPGHYEVQIYDTNETGEITINESSGETSLGKVKLQKR